jgi:hypothetical protein
MRCNRYRRLEMRWEHSTHPQSGNPDTNNWVAMRSFYVCSVSDLTRPKPTPQFSRDLGCGTGLCRPVAE